MKKPATNCFEVINEEFKFLEGNREVNDKHADQILQAIEDGIYLPAILVDENSKCIIDGQHRYSAYLKHWKNGGTRPMLVQYYKTDNPFADAIIFNNTAIPWTLKVYIKAFAVAGNPEYIYFLNWLDNMLEYIPSNWNEDRLPYEKLMVPLGVYNTKSVKRGDLQVTESRYDYAEQFLYMFGENTQIFRYVASIKGFYRLLKDHPRMMYWSKERVQYYNELCNEHPAEPFTKIGDWKTYFEEIYEDLI